MNAVSRLTSHLHAGPRSVAPVRSILKPAPAVLHFRSAVPTKHSLRRSNVVLASFLPDAVDNVLTTSTLVAAGLAILGSAALTVRVDRLPESVQRQKQDEEGFEYGVMGFISFIPLFNWTAWILPALTNPERAPLYYSLAALYAAPLLRNGFDLDSYVWAMWALMIVHIQVERIAQTEPQTLRDLTPVSGLLRAVAALIGQSGGFLSSLFGIVAQDSSRIVRGGSNPADPRSTRGPIGAEPPPSPEEVDVDRSTGVGRGAGKFLPREGEGHVPVDQLELKEFDRKMLERDRVRLQQQQQQQRGQEQGRGGGGRQGRR